MPCGGRLFYIGRTFPLVVLENVCQAPATLLWVQQRPQSGASQLWAMSVKPRYISIRAWLEL
jgi:hypothetical protein